MLSVSWKGQEEEGRSWTEDINRPQEIEVLYQGCKNFWRSGANVDIILLAHKNYGLIEVVTYAPGVDREAHRLYLNDDILFSLLDTAQCEESLRKAKELLLRQRKVPDKAMLMAAIVKESKINYIVNRLNTEEYSVETRSFTVSFEFNWRDSIRVDGAADKLLRERPRYMKRFVSPHYRSLIQGEIEACYNNIAADQAMIAELRERAAAAEGRVDRALTAMERWRLPMLYLKMLRGRFVGNKDAKIWKQVQKNFKDQDVIAAVKKALEEPLPPSSLPSTPSPSPPSPCLPAVSEMRVSISTDPDVQDKPSLLKKESHRSLGSRPSTPTPRAPMGRQKGSSGSLQSPRAVLSSPRLLSPRLLSAASTPRSTSRANTSATSDSSLSKKPSLVRQNSVARAVPSAPSSNLISAPVEKQEAPAAPPQGGLLSSVVCSIKRRLSSLLDVKISPHFSSKIACEEPDIGTGVGSLETETSLEMEMVMVATEHEAGSPSRHKTHEALTVSGDTSTETVPVTSPREEHPREGRMGRAFRREVSDESASLIGGLTITTTVTTTLGEATTRRHINPGAGTDRKPPTSNAGTPTTHKETPSATPTAPRDKRGHTVQREKSVTQEGETRVKRMGRIMAGMGMEW